MKPRVNIEYEIETNGSTVKKSLPFIVGLIGDFTGSHSPYNQTDPTERDFIPINLENLNEVMKQLKPTIEIQTAPLNGDTSLSTLHLSFESMQDFEPEAIIQRVPELKRLWQLRQSLKELQLEHISVDEQQRKLKLILDQHDTEDYHHD